MNKSTFILFSLIVPVLLASGCDGGDTRTEVVSTDMLVIEDIHAIPSQTVRDGDTIVIRMDVTNTGQKNVWMLVDDDGGKSGNMVLVNHCERMYELQKEGGFDIISVSKKTKCETPDAGFKVEISGKDLSDPCYVKFVPDQTHVFQWTIKAPSNDKLHGLTNECTFNFQTIYAGIAETITYVYFAIPHEVAQRIYTKNDLTLVGDNVASYGPVVANFETGEAQPIRAGSDDTWTVYLNLKNLGSGVAKIKEIDLDVIGDSNIKTSATWITIDGIPSIQKTCEFYGGEMGLKRSDIDEKLEGEPQDQISGFDIYIKSKDVGCGSDPGTDSGIFAQNSYDCCIKEKIGNTDEFPEKCKKGNCYYLNGIASEKFCNHFLTLRNKLEIFEKESSRISCTLTAPKGVNIMQPYKFVTRAHYAYSQGRDFKIKTEPKP